jgi:general secretion pathway protein H
MERTGGFTLIELLVVTFLIGLISGFAVLSVSSIGDNREIEDNIRLLQYQLSIAGEESVVKGRPIGVRFEQEKHSFYIAGKDEWIELEDDKVLKPGELQHNWKYELLIGGEHLPLAESSEDSSENEQISPQIIFYSSGEVDHFELQIVDENNSLKYRIVYGEKGVISLESVDES